MTKRIRVPGLIDILRVDDPVLIRALAEDPHLDRAFNGEGPLLNRLIAGRIQRAFQVSGVPFAAVAPRHYPERAARQLRLEQDLAARLAVGPPGPDHLPALAEFVRGGLSDAALGLTAQEVVGRLFDPAYTASDETWRAACLLDSVPRTFNPLSRLQWALFGSVDKARQLLARGVRGDPAAMHATAVAVHTLVRSLHELRALWSGPIPRASIPPATAAARSLRAPHQVVRSWTGRTTNTIGSVCPGVLTIFQLDKARFRGPGPQSTFMAGTWSQCPAHYWTTALLEAVWSKAIAGDQGAL